MNRSPGPAPPPPSSAFNDLRQSLVPAASPASQPQGLPYHTYRSEQQQQQQPSAALYSHQSLSRSPSRLDVVVGESEGPQRPAGTGYVPGETLARRLSWVPPATKACFQSSFPVPEAHDIPARPSTSPGTAPTASSASASASAPVQTQSQGQGQGRAHAPGPRATNQLRIPGACLHCRKLKMKCQFANEHDTQCKRCRASSLDCRVVGRKPRVSFNTRREEQLRQKDAVIHTLLKQLRLQPPNAPVSSRSSPSHSETSSDHHALEDFQQWVSGAPRPALKVQTTIERPDSTGTSPRTTPRCRSRSGPGECSPADFLANLPHASTHETSPLKETPDHAKNLHALPTLETLVAQSSNLPDILTSGLLSIAEVEILFNIYFEKIHIPFALLDPALYTPTATLSRCHFLFTTILATASRFFVQRPELYPIFMHYAKALAASSLVDGIKTLERCQAYLLLHTFSASSPDWEGDRGELYLSLSVRLASDLGIYSALEEVVPPQEAEARESLNRARTWIFCFNADRSLSHLLGKQPMLLENQRDGDASADELLAQSTAWASGSKYNLPSDLVACCHTALMRMLSYLHGREGLSFQGTAEEIVRFGNETLSRIVCSSSRHDSAFMYRLSLFSFLISYHRLVILFHSLQTLLTKGERPSDEDTMSCINAAACAVETLLDNLAPSPFLRYTNDANWVFASFSCAFLLQLLQSEQATILDDHHKTQLLSLAARLVHSMAMHGSLIGESSAPALHARRLSLLLPPSFMLHSISQSSDSSHESHEQDTTPSANTAPIVSHHYGGGEITPPTSSSSTDYNSPVAYGGSWDWSTTAAPPSSTTWNSPRKINSPDSVIGRIVPFSPVPVPPAPQHGMLAPPTIPPVDDPQFWGAIMDWTMSYDSVATAGST